MYKSRHFTIYELVHPYILDWLKARYQDWEDRAWMMFDADVLGDADYLRDEWGGAIYCNRIAYGLDSRGLRPPNDPDGAQFSDHKRGVALDLEPANGQVDSFYNFVKAKMEAGVMLALNTLEHIDDTRHSWVHAAKRNHGKLCVVIRI